MEWGGRGGEGEGSRREEEDGREEEEGREVGGKRKRKKSDMSKGIGMFGLWNEDNIEAKTTDVLLIR